MTTRELSTLIKALLSLGMQKLRLTGGEPLLRKDLPEVITEVRALSIELGQPLEIALTTNASRLSAQAQALFDAGLDRLTISLDSLDPERFAQLSGGRGRLSEVLEGIAAAQAAGFARLKFNCVVQKGVNETDVLRICEHFRGTPHTPRFIEYMDVGTSNGWQASDVVSSSELIARIAAHYPLRKIAQPMMGEVAQRYAYADGAGEIGFVSSISAPFCRGCTRARVAADGKLFTCLFSTHGHDLKALLGTGDYALVARAIRAIWAAREDRYSELRAQRLANKGSLPAPEKAEMYHLGG